jgi:dTDP-4-dehydrorhamnose reductase
MTGAGGLLAHSVRPALEAAGHSVRGLSHAEADVTRPAPLEAAAREFRPDWIFHFAALTRVDECETRRDLAFDVNEAGSRNVARVAAECGASLLAISSDYVFDGRSRRPYLETDPTAPLGVYGASKWAGEQAIREQGVRHVIVRTAWLFGPGGGNFVDSILKKARGGEALTVVSDQTGSPTYAEDLAKALIRLAEIAEYGTYHVVNRGEATWFDLAREAVREAGLRVEVVATSTAKLARPAPRPAYSVLDTGRFQQVSGMTLPDWRDALARHVRGERA